MGEPVLTIALSEEQAEAIAQRAAELVLAGLRAGDPSRERLSSGGPSLCPAEVAAQLGLSRKTVYAAIQAGQLRASQVRGRWRIGQAAVDAWIEAGRAVPHEPEMPRLAGLSAGRGGRLRKKLTGGGPADGRPLQHSPRAVSAGGPR